MRNPGKFFPEEIFLNSIIAKFLLFYLFALIYYYFTLLLLYYTITFSFALTLWRGTAGMLHVLLRYWLGPRTPAAEPEGLVGLGPHGLAPVLRCDEDDTAPGLNAGVLVGLLVDGDKWPQGPASACRNLAQRK